jgi:hypothetical protein
MLEDMAGSESQNFVSWQPHGKAFRVHQPEMFTEMIIPRYFKQTKYKSFQRQLHLYGFRRICKGLDKGAYYHTLFIRNKKSMSLRMIRQRIKGTAGSNNDAEIQDPQFYSETAGDQQQQQYNIDIQNCRRASPEVSLSTISYPETPANPVTSTSNPDFWVALAETLLSREYYLLNKSNSTISNIQSGGNNVNTKQETCFSSDDGDQVFGKKFFFLDTSDLSSVVIDGRRSSVNYTSRSA